MTNRNVKATTFEVEFWNIIDRTLHANGEDDQVAMLSKILNSLPEPEVRRFDDAFGHCLARAFTWDLWGAAYVINGGCSDDGFRYFRSWLISKGSTIYSLALTDADSLADVLTGEEHGMEFESFEYVARQVLEKNGSDVGVSFSSTRELSEPTGNPFEEDAQTLQVRYPKLTKLYPAGL